MRRPKKYQKGEGSQYVTRKQALRKLQLSLNDFRRLCIIKGIYPREPKHRRRAQRGSTDIKILYHSKDIKFLLHEPIVWTLRDYKIFARKAGRDRAIRDFKNLKRRINSHPELKLDHVVKERYPTFIDAIKDLDDCLTLLFLFSTFPSLKLIPRTQSALCRRLTIEFLHAMIAAKALRKVFISIKGYYFQADIKGQKVTWIIPHYYPFQPQSKSEVDFKIMSIFVEFYSIMLGFVNFRLYHSLNLTYPPQFPTGLLQDSKETLDNEQAFVADRIAALNIDLLKTGASTVEEEGEEDIDLDLLNDKENTEKMQKLKQEALEVKRLRNLFKGLKFFINREVPREPLVVIIRSFGGKVSWDKTTFPGSTFDENDETITHEIVDRPSLEKQYISRDYIQPQWVFDSVNQRTLLPTNKYFIGAVLPPHLSPFVDSERDTYIPPEEKVLHDPSLIETKENSDEDISEEEDGTEKTEEDLDTQLEKAFQEEMAEASEPEADEKTNTNEGDNETSDDPEKKRLAQKKSKMAVVSGTLQKENKGVERKLAYEEHKLQARMVKPRHRNLFRKLIREQQTKEKEVRLLKKKRKNIEVAEKEAKKQKKRDERRKMLGVV